MEITELEVKKSERARMQIDELGSYYMGDGILRRFEVESDSGRIYTVDEMSNDESCGDEILRTWNCDCPAGKYRRICKHVREVIAMIDSSSAD